MILEKRRLVPQAVLAEVPATLKRTGSDSVPVGLVRSAQESISLEIELVTTFAGLQALQTDYERLQRVTHNILPFALHEWHLTWCQHFLESSATIRTQPLILVFRQDSDTCVAIVPMIMTRRHLGPLAVCALDMLGPDPALTEIRAPLIEPGYEARVAWALQRRLEQSRNWDWISWTGVSATFGEALAVAAELNWRAPQLDYVLDLPGTWDQLYAGLKRNIRESLRHCYNSLKRDGHAFTLRVAQEPQAVQEAIDRFLVLHAMRAAQTGTIDHPNHFAGTAVRRFLHDVCARLAARGAVRVFQLEIGGEVVACRIGFLVGDSLYLYYSGFDPSWGKYSVMTTTLAEAIKFAIGQGYTTVNLSPGTDTGKTRWGPRQVVYGSAVQVAKPFKSRLAHDLYQRSRSGSAMPSWLSALWQGRKRQWT